MSKLTSEYIRHILKEIEFLAGQTQNLSEDQFMRDETVERAFARSLEIIGEAIKLIPDDVKTRYPAVDWRSFAGLRDKLIHHYFGVDYSLVWDVVKNELPQLKPHLEQMLIDETQKRENVI